MFPSKIYKFKTNFEYPTVAFELAHLALIWLVMNIHLVYKPLNQEEIWQEAGMDSQGQATLEWISTYNNSNNKTECWQKPLILENAEEKMLRWKKRPKRKELQQNEQNKRFFFCSLYILVLFFFCAIEMQHSVCSSRFLDLSGILQNVKKGL